MSSSFKRFNISVKGNEKKNEPGKHYWNRVGSITVFSDQPIQEGVISGMSVKIDLFPGTEMKAFEEKPRDFNNAAPASNNPFG